jgi:hypothetical protein
VAASSEQGNEHSRFIKCGKFLGQTSNYQLVKKDSAPMSYLFRFISPCVASIVVLTLSALSLALTKTLFWHPSSYLFSIAFCLFPAFPYTSPHSTTNESPSTSFLQTNMRTSKQDAACYRADYSGFSVLHWYSVGGARFESRSQHGYPH